jgi:hypothetical protein
MWKEPIYASTKNLRTSCSESKSWVGVRRCIVTQVMVPSHAVMISVFSRIWYGAKEAEARYPILVHIMYLPRPYDVRTLLELRSLERSTHYGWPSTASNQHDGGVPKSCRRLIRQVYSTHWTIEWCLQCERTYKVAVRFFCERIYWSSYAQQARTLRML